MVQEDSRDRNLSVHSSDPEENKNKPNSQKAEPRKIARHPDGSLKFYADDTPRAQRPKMDFYGPYVQPLPRRQTHDKIALTDRGYAMCQYDPTHIVPATALKSHENGCPDRDIDRIFEKMIRKSVYLQQEKK